MDYNDVALFVHVVDAGSFAAAARELGQQKSAVSRGVARLEKSLGVRLLQRTTRKLSLTDAGGQFYAEVRPAVSGLESAADDVRERGGTPRGTVRVTAPPDAYTFGLADIVARFVDAYPEIYVDLTLTSRKVDLVGEGFDIAIRAGRLKDSSLVARKIGGNDVALFAAPSYLDRRGRPERLRELLEHDCVLLGARDGRTLWELEGPRGRERIAVTGRVSVDDMSFAARTAAAGAGIALLSLGLSQGAVVRGELERVLPAYRFAGAQLYAVLPSSKHVPVRVAVFRDFLIEHLGKAMRQAVKQCASRSGRISSAAE